MGDTQTFGAHLTSTNDKIPSDLNYVWSYDNNETINNNGKSSISITWKNAGIHTLSLKVFDNKNNLEPIAISSMQVNVLNKTNTRYGLTIDGTDSITNRQYSNQAVDFDSVTNNAQTSFRQKLAQDKANKYINQIVNEYINTFKG